MMMKQKTFVAVLAALISYSSLATPSDARSVRYCKAYARDVANDRAGGPEILGGTVGGALVGAGIGAIVGGRNSVRDGAIIGGVTGTVAGGVHANQKWRKHYDRAYARCRSW